MKKEDLEAFEKWWAQLENENGHQRSPSNRSARKAWQAALDFRDNGLDERFAKTYMEGMKIGELKERERSKKLIEALEVVSMYSRINHDKANDYGEIADLALAEYRGEK